MRIRLPKSDQVWLYLVAGLLVLAAGVLLGGTIVAALWVAGAITPF